MRYLNARYLSVNFILSNHRFTYFIFIFFRKRKYKSEGKGRTTRTKRSKKVEEKLQEKESKTSQLSYIQPELKSIIHYLNHGSLQHFKADYTFSLISYID